MSVHVLGQWHDEASRYTRINGAWRQATGVYIHAGGQWRAAQQFVAPFSASAPTDTAGGSYSQKPVSQTVVSSVVTVTPSGGASPYSYAWTRVDGDTRITATDPAMASTAFRATLRGEDVTGTFRWTVTDSNGQTATGTVAVDLEQTSGLGS